MQKAGKDKGNEPEGFHASSQEPSRTALELRPGTRALHALHRGSSKMGHKYFYTAHTKTEFSI